MHRPAVTRHGPAVTAVRTVTPEEAVRRIQPGQRVFLATGAAVPQTLVRALCKDRRRLADIEIVHLLTLGEACYAAPDMQDIFAINTFFISDNDREAVQRGVGEFTPIEFADVPRLFASGELPIDVALIQVSPPDGSGHVSLGVAVDVIKSAIENAALVIAQVNGFMPRTHGDSLLHVWDVDLLVPADEPLPELPAPAADAALERMGWHVASLVEHGSTLQVGIGQVPQAMLSHLLDKRDLGMHTEMIGDGIIPLVEAGVLTGHSKTFDPGEIVTSFCLGSRQLYDYVRDNPRISFRRMEYVLDLAILARQQRMVAINSALQVDLTGQVCVDSLGTHFYSGLGGLVSCHYGASHAPGGKAIIALPATAGHGKISRIVDKLTPGSGVAIHRGSVQYVVTEFGVAYLHGKSIQERALALIGISHPDFRAKLLASAIQLGYLRAEMTQVEGKIIMGPQEIVPVPFQLAREKVLLVSSQALKTSMVLPDGTLITFRHVQPTDKKAVKEILYSLSASSVYKRFMTSLKRFPFQQIKNFLYVDHRQDVVLVGTVPEAAGEKIIAIGGYYLTPATNRAEVAFLVRDAWQGQGIGTFLMRHLATLAKRNGLVGLTAETLKDNQAMHAVLAKCGWPVHSHLEEDLLYFQIDFTREAEGSSR